MSNEIYLCEECNCMTRGLPTCGKCGAWRSDDILEKTKSEGKSHPNKLKIR